MTELERIAMLIVLETPRRSANAYQSYDRRALLAELEAELRKLGLPVDGGLQRVRELQRKAKAERDARIAAYNESESEEAQAQRKAQYKAAMQQREQGQRK